MRCPWLRGWRWLPRPPREPARALRRLRVSPVPASGHYFKSAHDSAEARSHQRGVDGARQSLQLGHGQFRARRDEAEHGAQRRHQAGGEILHKVRREPCLEHAQNLRSRGARTRGGGQRRPARARATLRRYFRHSEARSRRWSSAAGPRGERYVDDCEPCRDARGLELKRSPSLSLRAGVTPIVSMPRGRERRGGLKRTRTPSRLPLRVRVIVQEEPQQPAHELRRRAHLRGDMSAERVRWWRRQRQQQRTWR